MTVIRRTRTVTRPVVQQARRTRLQVQTRDHYREVVGELQLIAELDKEQEELTRRRQEVEQRIEAMMQEGKLGSVDDGVFEAKRSEVMTRASTEIDVAKFRKAVGDKQFFSVCSVTMAAAKDLLSEKELYDVSTRTEGAGTGKYKTTIGRIKKKK